MLRMLRLPAVALLALTSAFAQQTGVVGTWGSSPMMSVDKTAGLQDETFREIVHVSIAGTSTVSVTFTNEFGTQPLLIGAASIARRTTGSDVETPVALTFHGASSITIPAGKRVESDQVALTFPAMSDLAVSVFLPAQAITTVSQHSFADTTNYVAAGNQTAAPSLTDAKTNAFWRYVKNVQVPSTGFSIVCFGDSITDGAHSTRDKNARWPDVLAARLQANPKMTNIGVINQGIGGNRILNDTTGPAAVDRFQRDVLEQPGVRYVIILEAINDIGHAYTLNKPYDIVSADELILGYKFLAARAHAHGIKVYFATLTPYGGAGYSSPQGEVVRTNLNNWMRTSKDIDGFIDFDKVTGDPANPKAFLAAYDSGDHLHPSDAGYKAMGEAIDLKMFEK